MSDVPLVLAIALAREALYDLTPRHRAAFSSLIKSAEGFARAADDRQTKLLELIAEYAEHSSWRCAYRDRYGKCQCGLDDEMAKLGLPPVPVHDPEAKT